MPGRFFYVPQKLLLHIDPIVTDFEAVLRNDLHLILDTWLEEFPEPSDNQGQIGGNNHYHSKVQ